jgi:hypothetical protein
VIVGLKWCELASLVDTCNVCELKASYGRAVPPELFWCAVVTMVDTVTGYDFLCCESCTRSR